MKHGTPQEVVDIIDQHIPVGTVNVLEPSVGLGALLAPLKKKRFRNVKELLVVDVNSERLFSVQEMLRPYPICKNFVCGDFLDTEVKNDWFDLVIMNPPFNAKKSSFVFYDGKKVPIELAFLKKNLELLKNGGRLIAILPSSIIASDLYSGFREHLLSKFRVKKVYELNRFTFPNIEGRFYVLVIDKRKPSSKILFQKPFSENLAILKMGGREIMANGSRFDFSYHFSVLGLLQAQEKSNLKWAMVGDTCDVVRGDYSSPCIPGHILHTSSYENGKWVRKKGVIRKNRPTVLAGDIVLKRVSRSCEKSFGLYQNRNSTNFSDCVLRVRPKAEGSSIPVLFSLRCLYASELGKNFLVRGSGAKYISMDALKKASIPLNLHAEYPSQFQMYQNAVVDADYDKMVIVEQKVRNLLVE